MFGKRFGSESSSEEIRSSRSTKSSTSGFFTASNDASSASGSERSFAQHPKYRNDNKSKKNSDYIRSQSYHPGGDGPVYEDNSRNWRNRSTDESSNSSSMRGARKSEHLNWSASTLHGMEALDNLTPRFCAQGSVDSLVPKFAQIQVPSQSTSTGPPPQLPYTAVNRWREDTPRKSAGPDNRKTTSIPWSTRQKFEEGGLSQEEMFNALSKPKALIELLSSSTSFNRVCNELKSKTARVQVEDKERETQVREHLLHMMKPIYPSSEVYSYGSRPLGVGHPDCSVFSYFDSGNNYHGNPSYDKDAQDIVREAVYQQVLTSPVCSKARTWSKQEMVTYFHRDASLSCVVCVETGIRHRNMLLIKMFLELDDRVRPLMLLAVDLIYRYHDLSKYFTSYILQIMIIMYLQLLPEPVLPTLDHLRQTLPCDDVVIKGFDCSLPKDVSSLPPSQNKDSVEQLFYGFCTFYKNYDWKENVVSIQGPLMKRFMFKPNSEGTVPHDIKPPLSTYLEKLSSDTNESVRPINLELPIVVPDPFELSHNVAEKVTSTVLQVFTMMCDEAESLMSKWM